VTPAGLEPARPRLRVGRSTELSYGARDVVGRSRTCTPRVSSGRSTSFELRPRGMARLESNQRPLASKTGARPSELLARVRKVAELDLTYRPRDTFASPMSASPASATQDSDRYRVIRSKSSWLGAAEPDFDRLVRRKPNDVFHATRLPFGPGSTISCNRTPSYVEGFWSPILARTLEKRRLKLALIRPSHSQRAAAENLSLSGGASIRFRAVSS
jgi:hypothetical protein